MLLNRRNVLYETAAKLSEAMDQLDDDMQMILSLLLNAANSEHDGLTNFQQIAFKCIQIADESPKVFEFYLPQIIQVNIYIYIYIY